MPRKARHSEVLHEDEHAHHEEQAEPKGRKKRKNEQEHVEMIPVPDPEREQEAWDEFAADYYESELLLFVLVCTFSYKIVFLRRCQALQVAGFKEWMC